MTDLIHQAENDPELTSFLQQNAGKFNGHCLLALKILYSGVRLTDAKAVTDYGFSGRRLRELYHAFPDKVKKVWVKDANGKRKWVEYFIERPVPNSKKAEIEWATNFLNQMNSGELKQGTLL